MIAALTFHKFRSANTRLLHIIGRDKRDAFAFWQKPSRGCVVQHSKIDLLMPGSGQNENPPLSGLCQLPPAADIAVLMPTAAVCQKRK